MPEETYQARPPGQRVNTHCSICGKTREELRKLIVGKKGAICFECVSLCVDIIEIDRAEGTLSEGASSGSVNDAAGASAV